MKIKQEIQELKSYDKRMSGGVEYVYFSGVFRVDGLSYWESKEANVTHGMVRVIDGVLHYAGSVWLKKRTWPFGKAVFNVDWFRLPPIK